MQRDTILLDTLSIVPGSILMYKDAAVVDPGEYRVDGINGLLIWNMTDRIRTDSVMVRYRVFPILFTKTQQLRDRSLMEKKVTNQSDPFLSETARTSDNPVFGMDGLSKSGSISRGITIGNNQDAVVNSSLNLQLAGRVSGNIDVIAAITDDNIPVQADGNTQQLQEFDKVFIQLSNPNNKLIAGDFEVRNPDGYFMKYFKKGQGGLYNYNAPVEENGKILGNISVQLGAAVSKGKFARNQIAGIESNQGPYRLRGAENESFIVVLSGSEKIFLDGVLLDRGQDRDYIIDYNTAELTFTTKRIISKDSRIIAEFQYSDKNYARTMLTSGVGWQQKKFRASVNYFSEQDSKNQPVQQDLSAEDKQILADAGDDLTQAFAPNVDSVAFNANEILYAKGDTVVAGQLYATVYVYSTNADSAHYRVGFTNVGINNGNYVAVDGITNGRVYQWVVPVNGIPQGSYEPKVLLVSPKQRRMITAGAGYDFSKTTHLNTEIATSKNDLNRFSKKDKRNDNGAAGRISFDDVRALNKSKPEGWLFSTAAQAEITNKNFVPVENYRPVEFIRDWNAYSLTAPADEFLSNVVIGLSKKNTGEVQYNLRTFLRGAQYTGIIHQAGAAWKSGKFNVKGNGSILNTSGTTIKSTYIRHREEVSQGIGSWIPGIRFEQERNAIKIPGTDSLAVGAVGFYTGEVFVQRPDTVKIPFKISASRRIDESVSGDSYKKISTADMMSMSSSISRKKQKVGVQLNYRNLMIDKPQLTAIKDEESVSGRVEYTLTEWTGALQFNTYFEGGTGREPKKIFSYVEVAPGTGVYTWIDYNDDGIPQLNEFEIANFQDQANYIRVFTPTDDYVKVFFNQFNAVLGFTPAALFTGKDTVPFLSRFALQSSVRFDNRIAETDFTKGLNPFPTGIADSNLLTTQSSSRHSLYYNRSSSVFGMELTYQQQRAKQLLANGVESRQNESWTTTVRAGLTSWLNIQTSGEFGHKRLGSEAFSARDFDIRRANGIGKVNIQPGTVYRLSISYRYEDKKNVILEGANEQALIQDGGIEWRYSSVKQGILTTRINLVQINYDGVNNSSIAYEMLEGLKTGTNVTWGLSLQRNLGNSLQISLNYEGRKPAGVKMIHTGGAQVRAFF
ncbi:hypothetical protein BH11BAC2_BH11BAC2_07640 [soil metagenome]